MPKKSNEQRRRSVALLCCGTAIVAIFLLNMLVYTGSTIGNFRWRLEHGRLFLKVAGNVGNESFYIGANSEPVQFAAEGVWRGASNRSLTLPLWMPLLGIALAWLVNRSSGWRTSA